MRSAFMLFPSIGRRASPQAAVPLPARGRRDGPVSGLASMESPPSRGMTPQRRLAIPFPRIPLRGQRRPSTGFPSIRSHADHIPVAETCTRNNFQNPTLPVDVLWFFQYRWVMDAELSGLEAKLAQLLQRLNALRMENRDLRQTLAARTDENARLGEKLAAAKTRIEALLKQIPETET